MWLQISLVCRIRNTLDLILILVVNSSVFCSSEQQVAVGLDASDLSLGAERLSPVQNIIDFRVERLEGFSDLFQLTPTCEPGVMGGSEE